jgi:hypothetical protein
VRAIGKTAAYAAAVLTAAVAAFIWLVGGSATERAPPSGGLRPVWTEGRWPFPPDPWGKGKAFRCAAADCGSEVELYLRAKLGFCNCTTGVADDNDLERMGDLDLVGGEAAALGPGRTVAVGSMQGRSRAYALTARDRRGRSVVAIAFNERCDMIAATAVLQDGRAAAIEPAIVAFLNSSTALRWAEDALGL